MSFPSLEWKGYAESLATADLGVSEMFCREERLWEKKTDCEVRKLHLRLARLSGTSLPGDGRVGRVAFLNSQGN